MTDNSYSDDNNVNVNIFSSDFTVGTWSKNAMDLLGAVAAAIEFIYNAVTAYAATPQGEADIAIVEAELLKLGVDLGGITGSHTSTPTTQTPAQRAGLAK